MGIRAKQVQLSWTDADMFSNTVNYYKQEKDNINLKKQAFDNEDAAGIKAFRFQVDTQLVHNRMARWLRYHEHGLNMFVGKRNGNINDIMKKIAAVKKQLDFLRKTRSVEKLGDLAEQISLLFYGLQPNTKYGGLTMELWNLAISLMDDYRERYSKASQPVDVVNYAMPMFTQNDIRPF